MSQYNAHIVAFGKGEALITFYDNLQNPVDSEPIKTLQTGLYTFSVGMVRGTVSKYAFSLENKGFVSLQVKHAGTTTDVTAGANTIAFDFWNANTYKPTNTKAPYTQHVGNVVWIS
ncbi:hypothetical protein BG004_002799 [Podila humilis]|nr:hypothetical protein BG004_002799 [Podila humilis]